MTIETTLRLESLPRRVWLSLKMFEDVVASLGTAEVERVTLFGSYARGDARGDSDVDVLVLVEKRTKELLDILYEGVFEVLLKHGTHLSLKVIPVEVWERMKGRGEPFVRFIEQEGIDLWTLNPESVS